MKSPKSVATKCKTTGRFATAEEAARTKNADLLASLKKIHFKVVTKLMVLNG